jgi:hypothetical protein
VAKGTPRYAGTPDEIVAAIAARQHGVIAIAQLLAAGLTHDGIARRVRSRRLIRLYKGVYAVGNLGLSERGEALAAVLASGFGAGLGRLHAAWLLDVSRFRRPDRIEVVVPSFRRPSAAIRTLECRSLLSRDIIRVDRIPVTRPTRMLVDLTDVLTAHQLANVIHEAAFRGRFDLAEAQEALARANGRRNIKRLERAIALHLSGSAGTRSGAEDAYLTLVEHTDPLVNRHVLGEEVDFHWPDRRQVVEIDGPGHDRPAIRDSDARKDAKLREAGWDVRRLSDRQVYAMVRRAA